MKLKAYHVIIKDCGRPTRNAMWVIKTRYTDKLFASRLESHPQRPCVVVFETKKQAVQMRHMITMMYPQQPTKPSASPTGNWLIDNAHNLKPPHQPLNVEKWSLASVLNICNNNALDVVVVKEDIDSEPVHYPAIREYSDDVRFTLDCLYMYGSYR